MNAVERSWEMARKVEMGLQPREKLEEVVSPLSLPSFVPPANWEPLREWARKIEETKGKLAEVVGKLSEVEMALRGLDARRPRDAARVGGGVPRREEDRRRARGEGGRAGRHGAGVPPGGARRPPGQARGTGGLPGLGEGSAPCGRGGRAARGRGCGGESVLRPDPPGGGPVAHRDRRRGGPPRHRPPRRVEREISGGRSSSPRSWPTGRRPSRPSSTVHSWPTSRPGTGCRARWRHGVAP